MQCVDEHGGVRASAGPVRYMLFMRVTGASQAQDAFK